VDLHCHIELNEFFVNRVKSLVARIEVVVRGIELAGAESILLDAALNFPDGCLYVAERIDAARNAKRSGATALASKRKSLGV
jgi:hypothetical protein